MCHGYMSRWERRWEEERRQEEPLTYVSDPETEPAEPTLDDEPREPEREVVLTGASD